MITPNLLWFISFLAAEPACQPRGATFTLSFDEARWAKGTLERLPGVRGLAMRFDGKSDYLDLGAKPAYDVGEADFTLELWMRTTKRQASSLIDKRDSTPRGYQIFLLRDTIGVQVANGGHRAVAAPSAYPVIDGKWHHIVAVCRRLPLQAPAMYIDGELRVQPGRSAPLENLDIPESLWIGRHHANVAVPRDAVYYEGDLDEVVLYRRALPAPEIRDRYRAFTAAPRRLSPCR
ncbi:MAG: LamG domain-containing protein [Bryobacteraceae bacterium]|nr:LamG domain-containing protein [Bryobacteraceae bacterium]